MKLTYLTIALLCACDAAVAQVSQDPIGIGPVPELLHLFYDEWPTGMQ
jgi:hypothetical protein